MDIRAYELGYAMAAALSRCRLEQLRTIERELVELALGLAAVDRRIRELADRLSNGAIYRVAILLRAGDKTRQVG